MERTKTAKTLTSESVLPFPYLLTTNLLTIHDLSPSFQDNDSLLWLENLYLRTLLNQYKTTTLCLYKYTELYLKPDLTQLISLSLSLSQFYTSSRREGSEDIVWVFKYVTLSHIWLELNNLTKSWILIKFIQLLKSYKKIVFL